MVKVCKAIIADTIHEGFWLYKIDFYLLLLS